MAQNLTVVLHGTSRLSSPWELVKSSKVDPQTIILDKIMLILSTTGWDQGLLK